MKIYHRCGFLWQDIEEAGVKHANVLSKKVGASEELNVGELKKTDGLGSGDGLKGLDMG